MTGVGTLVKELSEGAEFLVKVGTMGGKKIRGLKTITVSLVLNYQQ